MNADLTTRIKQKINTYFNNKYPTTYPVIGLSDANLEVLIEKTVTLKSNQTENLSPRDKKVMLTQNINNLISLIEKKITTRMYSENRLRNTVNTNQFTMDSNSKISYDDYSISFKNSDMVGSLNVEKGKDYELNNNKKNYNGLNSSELDKLMLSMTKNSDDNKQNVSLMEGHIPDIKETLEKDNNILKNRMEDLKLIYEEDREFDYNIVIDSKDRDFTKYPNPNNFVIDFSPPNGSGAEINNGYVNRAFGNIIKCELISVIILDTSEEEDSTDTSGSKFPYLLLDIDELGHNYDGTNDNLSKTFAMLTTYQLVNGYKHYVLNGYNSDTTIKKVYNPRINLNRITIRLKQPDGTLYNFGTVNDENINTVIKLAFRITTLQKNLGTKFVNKAIY